MRRRTARERNTTRVTQPDVIVFAENLSLSADIVAPTDVTTDPIWVPPDRTKLLLTMNTHRLYAISTGVTTISINATVHGSNNGQTWFDASADIPDISEMTEANAQTSGNFFYRYIQLLISLQFSGSDGHLYWNGDFHGWFSS